MTLDAGEFMRRFLLHVLPRGFHRIRHYGLLANRHRQEKLARCRELIAMAVTPSVETDPTDANPATSTVPKTTVTPTRVCPRCGSGRMIVIAELPPPPKAARTRVCLEPCLTLDSS